MIYILMTIMINLINFTILINLTILYIHDRQERQDRQEYKGVYDDDLDDHLAFYSVSYLTTCRIRYKTKLSHLNSSRQVYGTWREKEGNENVYANKAINRSQFYHKRSS
jgi:hypothetical protein